MTENQEAKPKITRIELRLDPATDPGLHDRLKSQARAQGGRSVHSLIIEYVRRGLDADERREAERQAGGRS